MAERLVRTARAVGLTGETPIVHDAAAMLIEGSEMQEEAAKQFDAYDAGQSAHTTVGHLRAILSPTRGGVRRWECSTTW